MVSIPVKLFAATQDKDVSFHQLHKEDHSRIKYKKSCPIHGDIPQDEIVSGYEYSKDQYVVVDTDEQKLITPDKE